MRVCTISWRSGPRESGRRELAPRSLLPHSGPSTPLPPAFPRPTHAVSRSSLNRGFYAPDVPLTIKPNIPPERQENAMEQYGNATTFNLENVLRQNILVSSYYKQSAAPLESVHDLIDEIYYRWSGTVERRGRVHGGQASPSSTRSRPGCALPDLALPPLPSLPAHHTAAWSMWSRG